MRQTVNIAKLDTSPAFQKEQLSIFMDGKRKYLIYINSITCFKDEIKSPCSEIDPLPTFF